MKGTSLKSRNRTRKTIRLKWLSIPVLISIILLSSSLNAQEAYKIGVLAKRGAIKCMKGWKATADYLTEQIPGKSFVIIPLDFTEIYPSTEKGSVDFLIANSSFYVEVENMYGAEAIATLINSRRGEPLTQFGGVIFAKADNKAVNTLDDLKGKKFMAVKETSFGGWRMAYRLLVENDIDPYKDFAKMVFGGKHDNVLLAIINGTMDAGTVRTDTYERMTAEGAIKEEDLKVIHKIDHSGFPFVCSTQLYPEWPIAKVKHISHEVAAQVAESLIAMKPDSKAAKDAKCIGWTETLDYKPVDECLKILELGPYKKQ